MKVLSLKKLRNQLNACTKEYDRQGAKAMVNTDVTVKIIDIGGNVIGNCYKVVGVDSTSEGTSLLVSR